MIRQDELTKVDQGSGYFIGEIKTQHPKFQHLERETLVGLFDGLDTMLEFITENMKTPKSSTFDSSADRGHDGGFHTFETYDKALDIFRNKPEQVVKFDPSELRIKDESEAGTFVEYDVVGDYIDMGRYMEGIPESWGSMKNGNARNRRVNIIINLSQHAGIDEKDIAHRGERILRLVDALEAGGVRCQLRGIESTACNHVELIFKQHGEPLTISDLAVVAHPEFLRRVLFRFKEHSKTIDWGYGSPRAFVNSIDNHPELLHTDNNDEMTIMVDANMEGISSIDSTFDKLEKLLQWEMSKPVPEVDAVRVGRFGIHFEPNGNRSEAEIRREGVEAINA